MAALDVESRRLSLNWALRVLDEASSRYPDLAALAARARGVEGSLDSFIIAVEKEAQRRGANDTWKSGVLPRVVTAWMNGAGTESRQTLVDAEERFDDRRTQIIEAAERLHSLLRRNETQWPAEIGIDLKALPVSVRFPALIPDLAGLAAWARSSADRQSAIDGPKKAALFALEVDRMLEFQLPNEVIAELWRWLEQAEVTANAIRMARKRTNQA